MDDQAMRDYDYVTWDGRAPYFAAPPSVPAPPVIDTTHIHFATEREMRYWTSELGVTIYAIRAAIAATGTRCATTVRTHLVAA